MAFTFENRVAVVTGAGRGIGKAIAEKLASFGVNVVCVSKSASCEKVAEGIVAAGGKAEAMQVDVGDAAAVKEACEALNSKYEAIDILVNNAGITKDGLLVRMSDEDWDAVIRTNLSSAFYWSRGLLRPMTQKRWGRIINISSVVGLIGNPGQFNYCAAKAGMIGATKSLAKEVAGRSITVNAVTPGFIETDMTDVLPDNVKEQIMKMVPMKRMGVADDIANMVAFIASEESQYVTGQTFSVDGGMVM